MPKHNIPPRILYYLLDFKDRNLDWFMDYFRGRSKLNELTKQEIIWYYKYVCIEDEKLLYQRLNEQQIKKE